MKLCRCEANSTFDRVTSPFKKNILTDYYDGPQAGFTLCDNCLREFRFELSDSDGNSDRRLFAFMQATPGTLRNLLEIAQDNPRWPFWLPQTRAWLESDLTEFYGQSTEIRMFVLSSYACKRMIIFDDATPSAQALCRRYLRKKMVSFIPRPRIGSE